VKLDVSDALKKFRSKRTRGRGREDWITGEVLSGHCLFSRDTRNRLSA